MTVGVGEPTPSIAADGMGFRQRYGGAIEYIVIPIGAVVAALAAFGLFVFISGKSALDLYY